MMLIEQIQESFVGWKIEVSNTDLYVTIVFPIFRHSDTYLDPINVPVEEQIKSE